MNSLRNMVLDKLKEQNGMTDEELAYELRNWVPSTQAVSLICRQLDNEGVIKRIKRIGKPSGNYVIDEESQIKPEDVSEKLDIIIPKREDLPKLQKGQEHITELQRIGFQWVGDFTQSQENITFFVGEKNEIANILIALTIDGTVVLLVNSPRSLGQTLASLTSNSPPPYFQDYNRYLKAILSRGKHIHIYILGDPGGLKYVGHKLSLCAGLFPGLMEHFRPVWNKNVNEEAA
ncbi:MAG: hypothetical protein ACKVQS_02010 [Fimbriimonadaceae bacterium]